jgi:ribonuclease Z
LLKVLYIGIGSASPNLQVKPSAQLLYDGHQYNLIDCGEGTQYELLKYKINTELIARIFISHLHGDHYFGLVGLLSSMNLARRQKPLTIYGPKGLDQILLLSFKYSNTHLFFDLQFVETNCEDRIDLVDSNNFKVSCFPLNHRVDCFGFSFNTKSVQNKLNKEALRQLPSEQNIAIIKALKEGQNYTDPNTGTTYWAIDFIQESLYPIAYTYCSDTAPFTALTSYIPKNGYLYHEATFTNELTDRAELTFHSTSKQAAEVALKSASTQLILGHFSARYKTYETFLKEAKEVFENTILAQEGMWLEII